MTFLATYCFVFLTLAVALVIVAIVLQVRNMKNFHEGALDAMSRTLSGDDSKGAFGGFFGKFIPVAICMLLASVSFILFIVGVIAHFAG